MFSPSTYARRRRRLIEALRPETGLVLLLGHEPSPMNFAANPYPFRQDSTFLYYLGLDVPGLDAVFDLEEGTTCLYGADPDLDEVIWMGDRPTVADHAEQAGVDASASRSALPADVSAARDADRPVHLLPPYRERHHRRLTTLLNVPRDRVEAFVSPPLLDQVVDQRSIKDEAEIEQIETAVSVSARMHTAAMRRAAPGVVERELAGTLAGMAEAQGRGLSFRPTCSVHGEVLHNHEYGNTLAADDLLLVDAGGTSPLHYAGDVTRVVPADGSFSSRQRAVYEAVLDAQTAAIEAIEPGVPFRQIHRHACTVLTEHLIDLGLMTGPADDAVAAGAHALFFPHGLGHMLGLDVHDMENLGEDRVGYAADQERSDQFGLHTLRLARPLEPGHVVTVEPGCYFIPALVRQWREEGRHEAFINYDAVVDHLGFGGIRIEDDVLVTESGARVLGPGIPKAPSAVEAECSRAPEA
jgi:Xaa-Pro aminopeptidase